MNNETVKKKRNRVIPVLLYIICAPVILLAATLYIGVDFVHKTYGIALNELINTLAGNLTGTSQSVVNQVIQKCVTPIVAVFGVYVLICIVDLFFKKRTIFSFIILPLSLCALYFSWNFADQTMEIRKYFEIKSQYTNIYELYYTDINNVEITAPEKKKNLIYIYLESMETTYASKEDGGKQPENYIPKLSELASEYTSFSNSEKLGGFHTVTGAGNTMSAIFTSTTGIPYNFPVDVQDMENKETFASGIYTLGDFLEDEGYYTEFICGSIAAFGGRKLFYQEHGNYRIYDIYEAWGWGDIPEDYYVWWGYEDAKLFKIAKKRILNAAKKEEPFAITFLTVDLHQYEGYVCDQCGNQYNETTANICSCTDRQVYEFIEWCKKQSFYEDTLIVLIGDHPRMDTCLVDGIDYYDRTMYNCFINSEITTENTTNREFTHMDLLPTVISALGYQIDGERVALGTNIFSDKQTLAEQLGYEYLNEELPKNSYFYLPHFAPEMIESSETTTVE